MPIASYRRFVFSLLASWTTMCVLGPAFPSAHAEEPDAPGAFAPPSYPAVFDRLSPSYFVRPELPEGAVYSPALSPEREAELFLQALIEDAQHRATKAIDAALPPVAESSDVGPAQTIDKDWKKIDDTTKTPYKAICHLDCWFMTTAGKLKNLEGTGFMVSPRVIVTNAHNLYRSNMTGSWVTGIDVHPGRNGSEKPFGSQRATSFVIPGEYFGVPSKEAKNYDIGWIILPDRTLYNAGANYAFNYKTMSDASLKTQTMNCVGFPDSETYKYRMYLDSETKDQVVAASYFKHWLDTSSGSSGSPVYYIDSKTKERYVVGVHCAHSLSNEKGHPFNYATRMTKTYFEWTRDFIKQNP